MTYCLNLDMLFIMKIQNILLLPFKKDFIQVINKCQLKEDRN